MSNEDFVITLDIGSSQVRVIVAEINADGTPHIVGVGTAESQGMKKGAIINIDQAVQSIREAVDHAERMVGIEISEVFVGVSGHHVSLQPSHGVVAVSSEDREISLHDIDRVLQAARVIALPPERAVIEVVPKQFIVDGLMISKIQTEWYVLIGLPVHELDDAGRNAIASMSWSSLMLLNSGCVSEIRQTPL